VTRADIVAALRSGAWVGWVGTVLTAAVTFGWLNADQAGAIGNVVSAAATLIAAITAANHTLHAVRLLNHQHERPTP
jgi:hypothetical protein